MQKEFDPNGQIPDAADSDDVFDSPALARLLKLETDGFSFRLDGDRVLVRPFERLTPDDRLMLKTHRAAVQTILRLICDQDVLGRLDVFRHTLAIRSAEVLVPALVYRTDIAYRRGWCFSCGVPLPALRLGRSWPCSVALRLALGLGVPLSLAHVYDIARVA